MIYVCKILFVFEKTPLTVISTASYSIKRVKRQARIGFKNGLSFEFSF